MPIFVPEVPARVPADAAAHVLRRQEETTAYRLGNRRMSWLSSSSTRRQIVPMPGPERRRSKVLASNWVAGLAMARARSVRRWSSGAISARLPARLCGPAGSAMRSAPPCRRAVSASVVLTAGRWSGR
jgi:hypothetical protein